MSRSQPRLVLLVCAVALAVSFEPPSQPSRWERQLAELDSPRAVERRHRQCQQLRACLREYLPFEYDPASDGAWLEVARACLQGLPELQEFIDCLPFRFGVHAEDRRALEVIERPEPGCVQRATGGLVVRYVERMDWLTCHCLGSAFQGSGEAGGYNFCVPLSRRQRLPPRGEVALQYLTWRPFGVWNGHPGQWNRMKTHAITPNGRTALSVAFPRVIGVRVDSRHYRRPVETDFRMASATRIAQLVPRETLRLVRRVMQVRKQRIGREVHPGGSLAVLTWSSDGRGSSSEKVPADSALVQQLMLALTALPRLDCQATKELQLPFGGPVCLPGVVGADYLGLRTDGREIRVLTPPLADALCATFRSARTTARAEAN